MRTFFVRNFLRIFMSGCTEVQEFQFQFQLIFSYFRFPFCVSVSPFVPCAICFRAGCTGGKVWRLLFLLLPEMLAGLCACCIFTGEFHSPVQRARSQGSCCYGLQILLRALVTASHCTTKWPH